MRLSDTRQAEGKPRSNRRPPSRIGLAALAVGASLVLTAEAAHAAEIFTETSTILGDNVSASALFIMTGNTLKIILTNTSPANTQETPTSTLTGIEFSLTGNPALTPTSAVAGSIFDSAGCSPASGCTGSNVNVAGEFGYDRSGGLERIGSSGYITTGLAGDIGNFNNGAAGVDLDSNVSLDGIDFGILSQTHGPLNGGLTGVPLVQTSVTFTLTGVSGLTEAQIGRVAFIYGTGTLPGDVTPVASTFSSPVAEPAAVGLLGAGLFAIGLVRRPRRS